MATGTGNLLLQHMRGKIGKNLVIKQYPDKTVISAYPWTPKRKPAPIQKIYRGRFKEAVKYAKSIMYSLDPLNLELKKQYEQQLKPNQHLYHYLIAEYLRLLRSGETPPDHKQP
jgi:hypothetical protein